MHLCARCNKSQRLFFPNADFCILKTNSLYLASAHVSKSTLCVMYTVWKGKCWYARHMTRYLSYFEDGWEDTTETLLVPTIKALIYRNEEESALAASHVLLHFIITLASVHFKIWASVRTPFIKIISSNMTSTRGASTQWSWVVMNCIEIHY